MKSQYPRNDKIGLENDSSTFIETSFEYAGKTFFFHVRSTSELSIVKSCFTYYSPFWDGALFPRITRDDVILDVGAHAGFFAVPVSFMVSRVLAYEPSPANYQMLLTNIALNGCNNIVALNEAVCSTNSVQRFNLGVYGTTGHYLASVGRKVGNVYTMVDTRNIDDIAATILKMDAEGVEWEIFEKSALRNIRAMIVEMHKVSKHDWDVVDSFMTREGFTYTVKHSSWFSKVVAWR